MEQPDIRIKEFACPNCETEVSLFGRYLSKHRYPESSVFCPGSLIDVSAELAKRYFAVFQSTENSILWALSSLEDSDGLSEDGKQRLRKRIASLRIEQQERRRELVLVGGEAMLHRHESWLLAKNCAGNRRQSPSRG